MKGFIFVLLVVVIVLGMLCFLMYFLPSRLPDSQKVSPYECGFDPLKSARTPFSFRFFLVAMLFLLFDLEMALLFPLPYSFCMLVEQVFCVFIGSAFICLLTLGLVYEWMKGGLDWAN